MKTIVLSSERKVVIEIREEISVTTNMVELDHITDDGLCVTAIILIEGHGKNLLLWDNTTTPTYEGIGQYTDTDISNRINELL